MAEEYQTFGIRLPVSEVEFLDKVAEQKHVARVTVLRWAIDGYRASLDPLFLLDCPTDMSNELADTQNIPQPA